MNGKPSIVAGDTLRRLMVVLILFALVEFSFGADSTKVDFNFQVRPILSDRCFKCHGPDARSRKADLRLDIAEGAFAVRDKKNDLPAIVPGKPEKSEVIRRITSTNPDEQMPPPDSHLQLSSEEIALLRKWIQQGAEYKSHWAFIPVRKQAVPKIKSDWVRNPIDQFILSRLVSEKLKPAPEASKEILIRRLSFNLRGLPPTLQEQDDFLNDKSPDAYVKLVKRFLASSAYGEQMARDWLDLARYADTYGYQSDVERDVSPWRDWVIRVFNQNLSYDKFILWQIAGDLLPDATDEQILATAFNRLHRQTNEGGSIEEEFRAEYVADRVQTLGTAFLGITLECARCHDHKYDPIKQKDYYSLSAFLNNIDESGLYAHFTRATPTPTMLLYKESEKEKHMALKQQIAEQEKKLAQIEKTAKPRFETWQKQSASLSQMPPPVATFSFEQIANNKTPNISGTNFATLYDSPKQVEGHAGKALLFDGESSVVCNGIGDFKRTDPFTISFWIKPMEKQPRAVVLHHSRSWTDSGSRGYQLVLEDGRPNFALIHFWPGNAISIRGREALQLGEWTQLTLTYDGSSHASGLRIYCNGKLANIEVIRDNLSREILHRAEWGDADAGNIQLTLGARFRDAGFKNGAVDEFTVFDRCLTPLEITANATLVNANLFTFFLNRIDSEYQTAVIELKKRREAESRFVNDIREMMVMKEMAARRPTFVLKRGAYDAHGEPVEPDTPAGIFPFPKNLPKSRLGLAQWLIDSRNPLTARVVVNRIWRMHFGRGLVATQEDLGSQGQLPTHPELLDWLSRNFVESGWDIKKLHELIVTSATYRQSSLSSPQLLATDPDNHLLARGPAHRLQAEEIRDAALELSGLISPQIGGASVKPYQPTGLWEQSGTGKTYVQDKGEKLYRRSLYTFWCRTAPPPSMLTFDATSREVCTAKRETTTTPLQSLVLLNDPQFIEVCRVIAEKAIHEKSNDLDGDIEKLFRLIIGRTPQKREQEILHQLYQEQLEIFSTNAGAAEKFLAVGDKPRDAQLLANDVAALTVLVNTLINHDEFVMKR